MLADVFVVDQDLTALKLSNAAHSHQKCALASTCAPNDANFRASWYIKGQSTKHLWSGGSIAHVDIAESHTARTWPVTQGLRRICCMLERRLLLGFLFDLSQVKQPLD